MIKKLLSAFSRNLKNKPLWLSFLAGLSLVFAYAPFSLWWLPFIVITLWLIHIDKLVFTNPENLVRTITKHCFIFGFGWFASGISWVHVSIAEFGGMPLIVSLLLMLLLCLYLAIFPALAGYLSAKISVLVKSKDTTKTRFLMALLPSSWLFFEYCRSVFLTGFPWLSLGYSQITSPLSSLAPIIGEVGITFCLLVICVSLAKLLQKQNIIAALTSISCIFILTLIGHQNAWVIPTGKTAKVALVQGNIEQAIKWQPEEQWPTMLKYLDLTRINYDADLIVWPESAIPAIETMSTTQEFLDMANKSAALNHSAIVTGIINYNFESKEYFNSLIVLGNKYKEDHEGSYYYNNRNRYYKNHLLPIGEFVPFGDLLRPLAPFFNLPMSSFTRGKYVQSNLIANDLKILPLICFEIAFPQQLGANFSHDSDVLLTVSNDAWFGNSHGPHQHMEIAQMRALEFGRPLLRSTNNGVTAVTDHLGNIIKQLPQFEQAVLKTKIELVKGKTPYSKHGNLPIWVFAFFIATLVIIRKKLLPPALSK